MILQIIFLIYASLQKTKLIVSLIEILHIKWSIITVALVALCLFQFCFCFFGLLSFLIIPLIRRACIKRLTATYSPTTRIKISMILQIIFLIYASLQKTKLIVSLIEILHIKWSIITVALVALCLFQFCFCFFGLLSFLIIPLIRRACIKRSTYIKRSPPIPVNDR